MLVEIENLSGGYGGADVVNGVSCSADAGEILCLVGPNGCGKTTIFRLILGVLPASGGQIRISGKPIQSLSAKEMAHLVAYIPQHHAPVFAYTVLDMVIMGRAMRFSLFEGPNREDRDAAFAALEKMGISHLANQKAVELSSGQRQMALIARALCQEPKAFVMDEPGASLDYANQQLLMDAVTGLAEKGYCVIMSTHSPEHPLSVGHKILLMRQGRAAAFGKPDEVVTPETLEDIYDIEMDVLSVADRYGRRRTICLPAKKPGAGESLSAESTI